MANVEHVCDNIQGKNNKELADHNNSVQETLLDGTVNDHIHSGRKGLYSFGMQNFDDDKSDDDDSNGSDSEPKMNLTDLCPAMKTFKSKELGESEQLCANIAKGALFTKDKTVQSISESLFQII